MSAAPSPSFVRSVRASAPPSVSQQSSSSKALTDDILMPTPTAQESGIFLDSASTGDSDDEVNHPVSTGVLVGIALGGIAGIALAYVLGLYIYRRTQRRRREACRQSTMSWLNLAPDESECLAPGLCTGVRADAGAGRTAIKTTPFGRVQSPPPKRKSLAASLLSSRRSFMPKSSSQGRKPISYVLPETGALTCMVCSHG